MPQSEREQTCEWTQDADGWMWETTCRNAFEFNEGGPIDNGFRWCPYCGGRLHAEEADHAD